MNPDVETATAPGRLARRVEVICEAAHVDPRRLLTWIVAYAGLSASWTLGDGHDPRHALAIGEIAAARAGCLSQPTQAGHRLVDGLRPPPA